VPQSHRFKSSALDVGYRGVGETASEVVSENKLLFRLFFLVDDEEQTVYVEEAEEVDFEKVKRRLERGEEVFITRKGVRRIRDESG